MKKLIILTLLLIAPIAYGAWETTGNTITTGEYLGTNNAEDVVFKSNNQEKFRILNSGATDTNFYGIMGQISSTEFTLKFREDQEESFQIIGFKNGLDMITSISNFARGDNVLELVASSISSGTQGKIRLISDTATEVRNGKPLRFYNLGGFYKGFKANPNTNTDTDWILPENDIAGLLRSDGNGNLSFSNTLGTTTSQDVSIIRNNVETLRVTADGLRFMQPLLHISDSNGQVVLNHLAGGGTALYGFSGTRMVNLTANGVEIVGPLIAKNNYRTATTQTDNVTATDYTVECMPNGWENLPTAVGVTGKHYEFINPHNAMCTVFANGSELIGNLNPEPKYKIQAGGAVTIVSNNVGWRVISKYQVQ